MFDGGADVVVTDGFTGNAVLKSVEGTAQAIMGVLKSSIKDGGMKSKMGALLLKDSLMGMKDKMDYSSHGGAVLFGVKAPVVKTHGSTGPDAVRNTLSQIKTMLQEDLVKDLQTFFEESKA